MATAQPRRVIYPTSAERPAPLAHPQKRQRVVNNSPLAVAAFVAPAVAVTFILGRRLLRRGRRSPKAVQSNVSRCVALHLSDTIWMCRCRGS